MLFWVKPELLSMDFSRPRTADKILEAKNTSKLPEQAAQMTLACPCNCSMPQRWEEALVKGQVAGKSYPFLSFFKVPCQVHLKQCEPTEPLTWADHICNEHSAAGTQADMFENVLTGEFGDKPMKYNRSCSSNLPCLCQMVMVHSWGKQEPFCHTAVHWFQTLCMVWDDSGDGLLIAGFVFECRDLIGLLYRDLKRDTVFSRGMI